MLYGCREMVVHRLELQRKVELKMCAVQMKGGGGDEDWQQQQQVLIMVFKDELRLAWLMRRRSGLYPHGSGPSERVSCRNRMRNEVSPAPRVR